MPARPTIPNPPSHASRAGITGRGSQELLDAEQPADGIERSSDVRTGVSVHAASDDACLHACLYDGHVIPFSG
jgi:hypothetical protein